MGGERADGRAPTVSRAHVAAEEYVHLASLEHWVKVLKSLRLHIKILMH
jgi:hypothetical protein